MVWNFSFKEPFKGNSKLNTKNKKKTDILQFWLAQELENRQKDDRV